MSLRLKRITPLEHQHFYGYYLNNQYNQDDTLLLGHRCHVIGRWQQPEDAAELGVIDAANGHAWIPLAKSHAWNWQMGSMLQWIPGRRNWIIYNDCREGQLVSVVRHLDGRCEQVLPKPISTLHPNGEWALTLNFARKWRLWPETGYGGTCDPWSSEPAPAEDGIIKLNLRTGKSDLLISFRQMLDLDPDIPQRAPTYSFSHPLYNESGTRFAFWFFSQGIQGPDYTRQIRAYTANEDGTDITFHAAPCSHTCWRGDDKLLVYVYAAAKGPRLDYRLFDTTTGTGEPYGEDILTFDGHSTFSPDKQWLLTDRPEYANHIQNLCLFHPKTGTLHTLCRLPSRSEPAAGLRCHLHPRWSTSGTEVSIDSTHEGSRQIYTLDLSELLAKAT